MKRTLALLAVMLLMPSAAAEAGAEAGFVSRINAERSARGLPAMQVYWDLVDDARRHSEAMRAADDLHHNPGLGSVTSGWEALGENVGVGPGVDALHRAFMASPSHAANITGDYNYVGVGVVVDGDTMWVTIVFMKGPAGLVTPATPDEPGADDPGPEAPAEPPQTTTRGPQTVAAQPSSVPRAVGASRLTPRLR